MSSADDDYDDSCDDGDLEVDWQKIGIIVGGVVCGLLVICGIVALMMRKRKKASDVEQMSRMLDSMENQMDQREARSKRGDGYRDDGADEGDAKPPKALFVNDDPSVRLQGGPEPPPAYAQKLQGGGSLAQGLPYHPPSYQHQDQHFGTFNSIGPDVMR